MIIDEAHYLKNSKAQRTRAVYGDKIDLEGSPLKHAHHVWLLTGTPLLNHPAEFWTHLHALAPDTIILQGFGVMIESVFTDRFCVTQATPYGVRIRGARNTHELAARIKPFTDRKRLKDVILDMPELRIVEHSCCTKRDTRVDPDLAKRQLLRGDGRMRDPGNLDLVDDDRSCWRRFRQGASASQPCAA